MNGDDVGPAKQPDRTSRLRWAVLFGLLLPFTALTYLAVRSGSPGDLRDRPVVLTTLATITGPFVGAIARRGQDCCLASSARLAAICGPPLALGLIAQVIPSRGVRGAGAIRIALWTIGWTAWLLGGPASFLHALS